MEISSSEKVEDAFENVLRDSIDVLNDNREHLVQKLMNIESSLQVVHSWFEYGLKNTNNELSEQQTILVELNGREARFVDEEKRLDQVELDLNARIHVLNDLINVINNKLQTFDKIETDGRKRLNEIEKTKRDAQYERDNPIFGNILMAVRDRDLSKLIVPQTALEIWSKITFEKYFVTKDVKQAIEQIGFLETELNGVKNELKANSNEKERVTKALLDVKGQIECFEKNIIEKGQIVTVRNKVMNDFEIMKSRLTRIKDNYVTTVDHEEIDLDDYMNELVQLVFKAQRRFLDLDVTMPKCATLTH